MFLYLHELHCRYCACVHDTMNTSLQGIRLQTVNVGVPGFNLHGSDFSFVSVNIYKPIINQVLKSVLYVICF
jgi:hypothetical protein